MTPASGPVVDLNEDFPGPMEVDIPIAPVALPPAPLVQPPAVPLPVLIQVNQPAQPAPMNDAASRALPLAPGAEIWGPFEPSKIETLPELRCYDLAYHSDLNALLCTSCRTVVSAHHKSIHQHLKAHGVPAGGQHEAVAVVEDVYPTARTAMPGGQEFGTPQSPHAPFEGFELHRGGFGCSECMYAAASDKAVQRHVRQEHPAARLLKDVTWQRLGRGNDTAGFRVRLPV